MATKILRDSILRASGQRFISCEVQHILVGETLPVALFLYLDSHFVLFRAAGDVVDCQAYDRL